MKRRLVLHAVDYKMKLYLFYLTNMILFNTVGLKGQTITLHEYSQEDCETNCTFGLIQDIDTVVFKAMVDYSQDIHITCFYFQQRKKSDMEYFLLYDAIDVKDNCTVNEFISCEHIDTYVVLVTVRIIASEELSGAKIRGVIITSSGEYKTSDVQFYPEIAISTDIKSTLLIDGLEVKIKNSICFANATRSGVNLRYECKSNVLPCLIEISGTGLMKPLLSESCVSHTFVDPQLNITIKQALCTMDNEVKTFICDIKTNFESSAKHSVNIVWIFVITSIIILLSNCLCFFSIAWRHRRIIVKQEKITFGATSSLLKKGDDNKLADYKKEDDVKKYRTQNITTDDVLASDTVTEDTCLSDVQVCS